ncbi:MAG: BRO family protein [Deltaproteobacteria bacterium]|nr:BRO family protein [Deltaproteobacteria bacterium]
MAKTTPRLDHTLPPPVPPQFGWMENSFSLGFRAAWVSFLSRRSSEGAKAELPAIKDDRASRDFAQALHYTDYRNFEQVVQKARMACFNCGQRIEDHFVDITEMIEIGKGGRREVKTVLMSRYACYLVIQNGDASNEKVFEFGAAKLERLVGAGIKNIAGAFAVGHGGRLTGFEGRGNYIIRVSMHRIRRGMSEIGRWLCSKSTIKRFKAGTGIAYVVADDKDNIGKNFIWRHQILH